jgi:hypothetical protein
MKMPPRAGFFSRLFSENNDHLRRRDREILRARIAATVDDPAHVDHEVRDLFASLAS